MRDEPVAGVDYLVDHYAILGVAHEATHDEIEAAWRQMMMQYHTDRMQGLAPDLLQRAERKMHLLNEAHDVLGNPEQRAQYDTLYDTWEKPISHDGTPIIDLSAEGFSLSRLFAGMEGSSDEHDAKMIELAGQLAPFNEATYNFFKHQVESEAGLPPGLEKAWQEQLEAREVHLALRESLIRDSMGVRRKDGAPRLYYAEQIEEEVAAVVQEAHAAIDTQVLRLTAGKPALLPAPVGVSPDEGSVALMEHYTTRINQYLEAKKAELVPLVKEREEILRQRFQLTAQVSYHPLSTVFTERLAIQVKTPKNTTQWVTVIRTGPTHVEMSMEDGVKEMETDAGATAWIAKGWSIVSFFVQPGIDIQSQLLEVIEQHMSQVPHTETE